jgi:hypothetical protein
MPSGGFVSNCAFDSGIPLALQYVSRSVTTVPPIVQPGTKGFDKIEHPAMILTISIQGP